MTVKTAMPTVGETPKTVSAMRPPAITCAWMYTVVAIRITPAATARARRLE